MKKDLYKHPRFLIKTSHTFINSPKCIYKSFINSIGVWICLRENLYIYIFVVTPNVECAVSYYRYFIKDR